MLGSTTSPEKLAVIATHPRWEALDLLFAVAPETRNRKPPSRAGG